MGSRYYGEAYEYYLIYYKNECDMIYNQFNYDQMPEEVQFETPYGVSETIPDDTMTLREILDRYRKGSPITNQKVPQFFGEDEMPDFNAMTPQDRLDFGRSMKDYIEGQRKRLADFAKTSKSLIDENQHVEEAEVEETEHEKE